MIKHPLFPALCIVLGASVWGIYWVPQRAVTGPWIGSGWATVLVNLPALCLALVIATVLGAWREAVRPKVALAGACFGAGFACYAVALVETSVVRATILFYLTPIWGTLLAIGLLGERTTVHRWIAIALSIPGLALILGLGSGAFTGVGAGEVLGLISGFIWAIGAVIVRGETGLRVPALGLAQYTTTVGLGAILAFMLGDPAPPAAHGLATLSLGIVLYSCLALAAFYLIFWAMARMSPGRSGLLMTSEVVVAVISAAILLPDEAMGPLEWTGAALIFLAAVIEVRGAETG